MANRNQSLYNLYDIRRYVDGDNFKVIMDTANAKYNNAIWRDFASWGQPSDSRTWSQGEKTVPILARASLLGTHSRKPLRNTQGWKFYGGSTPKFGHGFGIGEDDLFQLRDAKNNQGTPWGDLIYDSLLTNSQNILGGMHNELSHMVLELASTGEIHEQSVDGTAYDFTFEFDPNQFFTVDPYWFDTNGDPQETVGGKKVDPIHDLLTIQEILTTVQNRMVDYWIVSKALLWKILDHPAVIRAYLANRAAYLASLSGGTLTISQSDYVVTRTEIANFLHDRGIWPFYVVDFKTVHEEDGQPVPDAPAFDVHMMTAAYSGQKMFEIKCTNSIWMDRQRWGGIDPSKMYHFVEGRIAALSKWEEDPIQNTVQFELYAGPVFNSLREVGFVKTYVDA